MSDKDDLLAEIQTVLMPGGASAISASDLDDLYEAYVITALVQAALAEQWAVQLEDIAEAPVSTALFRRSPGNIYSSPGGQAFTHFALSKAGVPDLEAHIGIKVTGKSDVEQSATLHCFRKMLRCSAGGIEFILEVRDCCSPLSASTTPGTSLLAWVERSSDSQPR